MAKRDYANKPKERKAATRPEPAQRARAKPKPAHKAPVGLIALGLIALGSLVGLVLFLTSSAPSPNTPVKQTAKPDLVAPSQPETVLSNQDIEPRAPGESLPLDEVQLDQEERFGFYKLLQENEVQTPEESAYTSTPKTAALDSAYILQVGSFRNQSDAEAMRAQLTLANLPSVQTSRSEGDNGVWFRVTTGPFLTYIELKAATSRLEKLNIQPIKRKIN